MSGTLKFCMVMALSAIGLKTSYGDIRKIGPKPMILGKYKATLFIPVSE
ncbi:putative sulfate exporter family transporter [Tissierella sp.]